MCCDNISSYLFEIQLRGKAAHTPEKKLWHRRTFRTRVSHKFLPLHQQAGCRILLRNGGGNTSSWTELSGKHDLKQQGEFNHRTVTVEY